MNTPFTLGGEQRVVTVLANSLVDSGYEVEFLLLDDRYKADYSIYNMKKEINVVFVKNSFKIKLKRKINYFIRKYLLNSKLISTS